jgi:hypothetical protein
LDGEFNALSGTYNLSVAEAGGGCSTDVSGCLEESGTSVDSFAFISSSTGRPTEPPCQEKIIKNNKNNRTPSIAPAQTPGHPLLDFSSVWLVETGQNEYKNAMKTTLDVGGQRSAYIKSNHPHAYERT